MTDTLVGKYFLGGSVNNPDDAVHGVVVGEVGRNGMFLLVRYFDRDTHKRQPYLRVVLLSSVLECWRFFPTKESLLAWLTDKDSSGGGQDVITLHTSPKLTS
jgi:hypothetical protein